MQTAQEIRQKLVLVIGDLICRSIEEARKIPFVLDQEQVVELLVGDPAVFAKLVREEQYDRTQYASNRLTAKLDAAIELGQFEALDAFDLSFASRIDSQAELDQVMAQVNQLTRTFAVYIGNIVTIFEKEFQLFMEKFRQSLQQIGMSIRAADLTPADMVGLERRAEAYLPAGQFLQAFAFDRMIHSQVITEELVHLPSPAYSFTRNLMRSALQDASQRAALVKFILRACYISQGSWQDIFGALVELADQEPDMCSRLFLIDRIEQDSVFCCNLLCESFANLRQLPPAERRTAIEGRLDRWRSKAGTA